MGGNGYAKDVLVTTEWLAEHLDDANVVVAEVDENSALYDRRARSRRGAPGLARGLAGSRSSATCSGATRSRS